MNLNYRMIVAILLILNPMSNIGAQSINAFNEVKATVQRAQLHTTSRAQLKADFIKNVKSYKNEPLSILLPDENGEPIFIDFESYNIFSETFALKDQTGKSYPFDKPDFYKGVVQGEKGFATMTVFEDRISAVISIEGKGNIHIAQDKDSKNPFEYWIYNDQDWKDEAPFDCHTEENNNNNKPIPNEAPAVLRSVDQCVEVYLEADFFMFQDYGTTQGVMDYLAEVWVHVAALYDVEEITVNISEIFVWTSNDPYSDTNGGDALITFLQTRTSYNGDIAHLVSTNPGNLGGIAFVDGLCSDAGYGFSNITNNYSPLPTYSWTINLLTHEIGHQLGAYHTHSCLWPNGPIDDCAPVEDGPCNPGPTPTNGGTIMSYCHLTGIGIDLNNGFGTVAGDHIRAKVAGATCLSICGGTGNAPVANFSHSYNNECAPGSVQFTDTSTGIPSTYSWQFEGGIPGTSGDQNPLVQYLAPGEFSVTLTVTNPNGIDSEIKNDLILIQDDPSISYSFSTPNDPNTFEFIGSGAGINSWSWQFGDGTSSTEQSPDHTYPGSGTYDVVLTGSNACGTIQENFTVSVALPPIAAFSQNKTEGCAPLLVNFLDLSQNNPTDYAWQLSGATPSSSTFHSPQVLYQNPGVFDVILQVTNSSGFDTEIKQDLITVEAGPVADFNSVTNGATVTFANSALNYNSILWDFGDGNTSFSPNPTHTYLTNGTFVATQTVENDCGSDDEKKNIVINVYPEASFTVNNDSGCTPLSVNFVNTSINNGITSWQFPGGSPASSTSTNPAVTYSTPGVYDVTMTVTNSFGSVTETFDEVISVGGDPSAAFEYDKVGLTFSFENLSQFGDSFLWNFGDANTSTEENPQHTFAEEGTYTVSLTVTSPCGSVTTSETITIFNTPFASILPGQREFCVGDLINFDTDLSDNITDFLWTISGPETVTSDEEDPVFFLSIPGEYSVTLEVSNPVGSDIVSLPNYLIIQSEPIIDFDYDINILQVSFEAQISQANSVLWSFGDGATSTQYNPTHQYADNGQYLVSLTAINDCGGNSFSQTINLDQLTFANFTADKTSFCQGEFVQFENNSTMSSNDYLWTFPGGVPSTSTEENPMVFYDVPGVYDVTLYVDNGITDDEVVFNDYIQVDASQPFQIENAPLVANVPTNIRFNYTNSVPGEYQWDFGDGSQSSVISPVHQYDMEGSYEVTLNFVNGCFELDTTFVLDVFSRPDPEFVINNGSGCAPFSISVDNLSPTNYTEIEWTAPGSIEQTSTEETPFFTYVNAGDYDVTLKLTNPLFEESITIENVVTVIDRPIADYSFDVNGLQVSFDDQSSGSTGQTWDFGDGNDTNTQNPTHIFPAEGTYEVELISRNVCGRDTLTQILDLYSQPTANFTSNQPTACRPASISFDNLSSDNAVDYAWTFEGAQTSTSNLKDPVVIYDQKGVFDVTLVVSNPLFSNTMVLEDYITINDVAETSFDFTQAGLEYNFNNLSTDADSYRWDFGDGTLSMEESPNHEYINPGSYLVSLTTTNECGTNFFSIQIEVKDIPGANFSVSNLKGCRGSEFTFFNLSDPETTSYVWSFPGSTTPTSIEESPVVIYNTAGFYDVTLISQSPFGADTTAFVNYIEVQDLPVPAFTTELIGSEIHVTNTTIGANEYLWVSEGQVSAEVNPVFVYPGNGQYLIELTATNACGSVMTSQVASVNSLPVIDFIVTESVCVGDVITLESLSANVETLTWYINDEIVGSGTESTLEITLDERGIYDVLLVGVNQYGQSELRKEQVLQVLGVPIADFASSSFGDQILFTDLSQDGVDYFWDFGDGFISISGGDQFHQFAQAGIYEVSLKVENECGTDTVTKSVNSNLLLPEPVFFSNHDLCVPTTLDINNETQGEVTNYYWRLSGPATIESFGQTPILDITVPGTYDLYIEFSNQFGGISQFYEDYVTILDVPNSEIIYAYEGGLGFNYASGDEMADVYYWEFGDGVESNLQSGIHEYTQAGSYEITHRASNVCGESSSTLSLVVDSPDFGTEDNIASMVILPNLDDNEGLLELKGFVSESFEIHVVNNLGQLIEKIDQSPLNGTRLISLKGRAKIYAAGIYHVWVKVADQRHAVSFVVY